jgi:hypothetical protein
MYHPARDRNTSASTTTTTYSQDDDRLSPRQKDEDVEEDNEDKENDTNTMTKEEEREKRTGGQVEEEGRTIRTPGNKASAAEIDELVATGKEGELDTPENKQGWDSEWVFLCAEQVKRDEEEVNGGGSGSGGGCGGGGGGSGSGSGGSGGVGWNGKESPKPFVTIHRASPGEIWMDEDHFESTPAEELEKKNVENC